MTASPIRLRRTSVTGMSVQRRTAPADFAHAGREPAESLANYLGRLVPAWVRQPVQPAGIGFLRTVGGGDELSVRAQAIRIELADLVIVGQQPVDQDPDRGLPEDRRR
jgi:hypothetical protein